MRVTIHELTDWLRTQREKAETALRAREESAVIWRSGEDADWAVAAGLHGRAPMLRAERLAIAHREDRIAERCRRDVAMFRLLEEKLARQKETALPQRKDPPRE